MREQTKPGKGLRVLSGFGVRCDSNLRAEQSQLSPASVRRYPRRPTGQEQTFLVRRLSGVPFEGSPAGGIGKRTLRLRGVLWAVPASAPPVIPLADAAKEEFEKCAVS